jgi:hypothetical protein
MSGLPVMVGTFNKLFVSMGETELIVSAPSVNPSEKLYWKFWKKYRIISNPKITTKKYNNNVFISHIFCLIIFNDKI